MSTASQGQQVTDSLNGKLTFEQDKNRIVGRDDDNMIRLLLLADGQDFRLRISKEGYDAVNATSDQLIFNSDQNIPKISLSGTITIDASIFGAAPTSTTATIDISGLNSPPLITAVAKEPDFNTYNPLPYIINPGTPYEVSVTAWVNFEPPDKEVVFQVLLGGSATAYEGIWSIKYYIYQETAN